MEQILEAFTSVAVEVITVLLGAIGIAIANKIRLYVDGLKKKDELGIIDSVTDSVTEWSEAQLKGKPGLEKRDFAIRQALHILESKGIKVDEAEVIAGIENGVNKLRAKQLEQRAIETFDGLSTTFPNH